MPAECCEGRDELRRTPSVHGGLSAALYARANAPTRSPARDYRLGPGERPQFAELGAEIPVRPAVRGPPIIPPRSPHPCVDGPPAPPPPRPPPTTPTPPTH